MNNEQFKQYIDTRLQDARERDDKEQIKLLEQAQKMGRYSSGQEFRRFRRDFERRNAKKKN